MSSSISGPFFVYMLRCSDDSLYIGLTADLFARVVTHNEGKGARYTARRLPVTLVYSERCDSIEQGQRREAQLKKWSRAKKEALIQGDARRLNELCRGS